jgi:GTP-binding protein
MFFVDLPGYGFARMPEKEREAIRKHILWYLAGGETHPRLIILILDARIGLTEHDKELVTVAKVEGHPLFILLNKADKLNQSDRAKSVKEIRAAAPEIPFLLFSAKDKEGVAEVRRRIFESAAK